MDNSKLATQKAERNKVLAINYITAVGQKQSEIISGLLNTTVEFNGPIMTLHSSNELIAAFNQLGKVLVRNEIKRIFSDENESCIIYDLILADDLEAVPCVEWLKIEKDKIVSIQLVFDSKLFLKVREKVINRMANK